MYSYDVMILSRRSSIAFIAGCVALALPGAAGSEAQEPPFTCSLAAGRPLGVTKPLRTQAQIRVRCNLRVHAEDFETNKGLVRVRPGPSLTGAASGESLSCGRESSKRPSCQGSIQPNTRVLIAIRLTQRRCRPKELRVRLNASGGRDCDPTGPPCPAIGLITKARTTSAYGC